MQIEIFSFEISSKTVYFICCSCQPDDGLLGRNVLLILDKRFALFDSVCCDSCIM